jgi:sulfate adenylyltransferase subunit 2
MPTTPQRLTHLRLLEAESIQIIREVASEFERPVMLYSIGKDSAVLVRLAIKAFHPMKVPFPLLHVDTTWKFREMIAFRDDFTKKNNLDLLVHTNQQGIADGINPFDHGSEKYTDIMKTQALKQALSKYEFDAAFGGARRDEERSRAKERVFSFRDRFTKENHLDLLVYTNQDGVKQGINPFDHGSEKYTTVMKTEALVQALTKFGFDAAFGGARRDEEKSRAKERIFSLRSAQHRWDPKQQRPELWNLYNSKVMKGESIRVFPLSNWTELDVWQYIYLENIPIVPLYFAKIRPVVERDGALIMVDDARMRLRPGEEPQQRMTRFRTLGCYPLSGAIESSAATLPEIIREMLLAKQSERQGRLIDHDQDASMERKKREGYF